jgi:hypothetical protein
MLVENRSLAVTAPPVDRAARADVPNSQRARRTNDPLSGMNMNTARGRRCADLVRAYLKSLGDPYDAGRQAAVIQAAELQVIAEETRAVALREPGKADLDAVVRIQGSADRALRRLGIKPGHAKPETLAEYLAKPYTAPAAPAAIVRPIQAKTSEDQP